MRLSRGRTLRIALVMLSIISVSFIVHTNKKFPTIATEIIKSNIHESSPNNFRKKSIVGSSMIGSVNCDEWHCPPFTGYLVDDLRLHHHQWPKHPTTRRSSSVVHVNYERLQYVGAKLYGYILPPISGIYQFRIRQIACTATVNSELWISSDSNPMNLQKLTQLTYNENPKIVIYNSTNTSGAHSVSFRENEIYYFEFHVKGFDGKVDMSVEWKLPYYEYFQPIPSASLAMAIKLQNFNSSKLSSIIKTLQSENLPSNKLQSTGYIKHITYNVSKVITELNILPQCNFTASYVSIKPVKQFRGVYKVFESMIFPPDDNQYYYFKILKYSKNKIIPSIVNKVLHLYTKEFYKLKNESNNINKVLGIHYLELTRNNALGSRFLLEMDIQSKDKLVRTSEYVYLPNGGTQLCHTSNFQWKQNAHVSLVVAIKNLGNWVDHLIHNIEDIYIQTKDEQFELVVVDFESDDKDIKRELMKSSIPKWKLIPLKGRFSRAAGLQAGIDYVTDNNSIVMTIDMHLTLPPNFIESVRKHTIQNKMAYAPMFFKLNAGYSENNINGYWDYLTYGLFSLYKSDWIAIGGFDLNIYKNRWGGEDWDLLDRSVSKGYEIYRCKPPGLFHYYHSKEGMWGMVKNKYSC